MEIAVTLILTLGFFYAKDLMAWVLCPLTTLKGRLEGQLHRNSYPLSHLLQVSSDMRHGEGHGFRRWLELAKTI